MLVAVRTRAKSMLSTGRTSTLPWALAAGVAYFAAARVGTQLVAQPDGIAAAR